MASIFNQDIGFNYKGIITLGSTINQNLSGSLQYLTDGDGNNLPLQVSTTGTQINYGVGIGGAPTTAGLQVYGQAGTTGLVFGGAAATMYIDLNGTGINFFDAAETRYRNFTNTLLAMNVWGSLGRVAIGGSAASPYTPSALLQVRGDGTNSIFRAENSDGTYRQLINTTQQIYNVTSGGIFSIRPNEGTTNNPGIDFQVYTFGGGAPIMRICSRYTIGSAVNNAQTGLIFANLDNIGANYRNSFLSTGFSVIPTSGIAGGIHYVDTFAAAAGSASYRPLSINYTINNTGAQTGVTTGIFLNATETNLNSMTHDLMDLQVGGVSKFKVNRVGTIILDGNIHSVTNDITLRQSSTAGNGGGFIVQRATNLYGAPILFMQDAVDNTFNFIDFRRGASTLMRLFSGGSLAIGHTAASARLHVRGDGTNAIGRFETSAGVAQFIIKSGGIINMPTLPTSSAGLSAGDLWNNGGVVSVV